MTEDKKKFETDELPPFPWRHESNVIFDAGHGEILKSHPFADGLAELVVLAMNQLAEDGWFMPVSKYNAQVYNDLVTSTNTLMRRNETLRRAIELIERYRETNEIDRAVGELVTLDHTPAELLDVVHDVLTSGGANAFEYEPCEHQVIPGAGPDGRCVAQATTDFDGKRYCRPHADALRDRFGDSL